jgi:hypothetical protein
MPGEREKLAHVLYVDDVRVQLREPAQTADA